MYVFWDLTQIDVTLSDRARAGMDTHVDTHVDSVVTGLFPVERFSLFCI